MSRSGAFRSLQTLTGDERYQRARELLFRLEDAVPFRLQDPQAVGQLVEARLRKRRDVTIASYAEKREIVRESLSKGGLWALVEAMAERYPEIRRNRQVIFSLELEVLMDQSYAEPYLRRIYEQALAEGKDVTFSENADYSPVFRTLLLEKNGFDRFRRDAPADDVLRIRLTPPQARSDRSLLTFTPQPSPYHFLSRFPCKNGEAGSFLAAGLMEQRLREEEVAGNPPEKSEVFALGYCLLGPGIVLLLQSLYGTPHPVNPRGRGSGFLTTTGQRLCSIWPDLPAIGSTSEDSPGIGLFPGKKVEVALLPEGPDKGDARCLVKLEEVAPVNCLLVPLRHLFMAFTDGPSKPLLQAAATAFAKDYAEATRGIHLPLPKRPILAHWRKQLLSPEEELVARLLRHGPYASARFRGTGSQGIRLLRSSCWPTATFTGARPWQKKILRIVSGGACAEIEAARGSAQR